jgi:HK97 family phage major capsid protein
MKDFLNKKIADTKAKIEDLKNKSDASTDVNELRSLNIEITEKRNELNEYEAELAKVEARNVEVEADLKEQEKRSKILGGFNPMNTINERNTNMYESAQYREAFMNYVMGKEAMPAEYRDNTLTSDVGVIIPTTVMNLIVERTENIGRILAETSQTNLPSGVAYPTSQFGQIKAVWVAEGEGSDKQKKTTGTVSFTNHKLRCEVSVSQEVGVMALSAFENRLAENIAKAIVRAKEDAVFNGTGVGQPKGILAEDLTDHTVEVAEITYDTLVEAEAMLNENYEDTAKWYMSKKTYLTAKNIKDKNGRPIFNDEGNRRYLFNREVIYTNDYLPSFAAAEADKYFAVIADLSDYVINSVYEIGITKRQNWDNENIETKAVTSCDGKILTLDSVVALKKVAQG